MRLYSGICLLIALCCAGAASYSQAQSSDEEIQHYSQLGQQALSSGDYPAAEQAFEKLRALEPEVAEVHANLGVIYFQERKYDQAVQALRQALKLKPSLRRPQSLLAISLAELGDYRQALPGLEKEFRQSTDPAIKRQCGLELMRTYSGLDQSSKAAAIAQEMNRLYPDDPEVLYHSGRVYGDLAFVTMQKLAQVAPGSVWRHQALGEAAESQEQFDTAISEYRQVLALDPGRPGIHYRLGRTFMARTRQTTSSEDLAAAQKEFEQELAIDPRNGNAAYEIAEARRNAGQLADAQNLFEQALKYHPDFEEAHLGLASVLMSEQKPQQALPHLQKAIALNSENEVSWYRLSQVQRMLGNNDEARKAFARFHDLHQRNQEQEEAGKRFFSPDEVTPQKLDAKATR